MYRTNSAESRAAARTPAGPRATVPARKADKSFLWVVAVLAVIGLMMVFDASYVKAGESGYTGGDQYFYLKRQLAWLGVGTVAFVTGMRIGYWRLQRWAVPILLTSVFLLILVLIPGIGKEVGGARRWLVLGPIQFQPSELAKFAVVVYTAAYVSRSGRLLQSLPRGLLPALAGMFIVSALILAQPDMGTTISICAVVVAILYAGGANRRHVTGLLVAGLLAGLLLAIAEPYRVRRLVTFLNPGADPQGDGYQVLQGLGALGSGGSLGLGLGESRAKWHYLPGEHTDFIFAVVGEEFGLFGTLVLVALFAALVYLGLRIARRCRDDFGYLLATGLTLAIGIQALINMGVVAALLPNTGVPLPLISYGGTALVLTLFALGLVADVSRRPVLPLANEQNDNRTYRGGDRRTYLPGPEYRRGARAPRRGHPVHRQR